jgi:hypothetical protein
MSLAPSAALPSTDDLLKIRLLNCTTLFGILGSSNALLVPQATGAEDQEASSANRSDSGLVACESGMERSTELAIAIPTWFSLPDLDQASSLSLASQPCPVDRFSRVKVPPCASAICRLRTKPIPVPPGLVVKKGTNRLDVFERPGPSS